LSALFDYHDGLCRKFSAQSRGFVRSLEGVPGVPLAMLLWNADGSRPQMCGNGLRCFARHVFAQGLVEGDEFYVRTDRGDLECSILRDHSGAIVEVEVDMGAPTLEPALIPMLGEGTRWIEQPWNIEQTTYTMTAVSMGNPHAVVFQEAFARERAHAPMLSRHALFPEGVNVEFVKALNQKTFEVCVYERGCGFTQACGTGACAVGVAAVLTQRAEAGTALRVCLPGGPLCITVAPDLSTVWMRGEAQMVFSGEISASFFEYE
ncbi:MAG: diaminopimelate epimerase, partial [Myxococcota bacterium]